MSGWAAVIVALIGLLAVSNLVFLVATMRQVGVLHQRIRPTGPGDFEGPEVGRRLPTLALVPINDAARDFALDAPRVTLVYVTPGCDMCEHIMPVIDAYTRSARDERVALVTDVADDEALAELAGRVRAPLLRQPGLAQACEIPGSPYALVLAVESDGSVVLGRGVVNSMEQFEDLLEQASVNAIAVDPGTAADNGAQRMVIHQSGGSNSVQ